ncbi:MAG: 7-cyano-7-deazaguanine synthase [Candidatus Aenigmatarchaeota archaeon]
MTKAIVLLSGGIDSPVAAWMIKRFGIELIALHFSNEKFTGKGPEEKAKKLADFLGIKKFISIDASEDFEKIATKCNRKYYFVLIKRYMMRKAEEIAKKEGCSFIVTGESLGQVSSQTLNNLISITKVATIPIIRPLLTMDKQEIIDLARRLGTFEISKGPEVCDLLGPKHPATKSRHEDLLKEEEKLNASGGI